jgi:hypothetical protein
LKGIAPSDLVVYEARNALEEDEQIGDRGDRKANALVVVVPAVAVAVAISSQRHAASIKKQLRYKGMSTEASCRKFLDALARKLSELYDFDFYYTVPTIGDVFHAVDNNTWEFRMKKRKPLTVIPLPDYFTKDEWKALHDLNKRTTLRIHDGKVPTTSKGKSYIILPHDIFNDEQVNRYKAIAAKGNVVFIPTELDVKDEDEFSSSSRSNSAHSADAGSP